MSGRLHQITHPCCWWWRCGQIAGRKEASHCAADASYLRPSWHACDTVFRYILTAVQYVHCRQFTMLADRLIISGRCFADWRIVDLPQRGRRVRSTSGAKRKDRNEKHTRADRLQRKWTVDRMSSHCIARPHRADDSTTPSAATHRQTDSSQLIKSATLELWA